MVSFVCFLCPGMFNALGGLGGGGQVDPTTADNTNVILYSVFAFFGFFAGSACNRLGIKVTITFGGFGYFLYAASFLSYNINQSKGFVYFAGALLGFCAALLWTAQGAIMTSYPLEKQKGRFIARFWVIFNTGAVIGSLVPLGENIHKASNSNVSNGTYIGFMVLMFIGFSLTIFLVDSSKVIRKDGSKVIVMKHPTWLSEFKGLWETIYTYPWIILLFPMFFSSNWFYTYQQNSVNAARFDTRTRALNGLLYWLMQLVGATFFGYSLDYLPFRRAMKARIAWVALFALTMAIWGGGYAYQRQYTRAEQSAPDVVKADWSSSGYIGPMFLYMFYGFFDACWQTCVYWYMVSLHHTNIAKLANTEQGAMTNNSRKLANFVGFYKGIQSAGAAVAFSVDAHKTPYMAEFASCWGLVAGSMVCALPVIWLTIKDTVTIEEDVKFSDETVEEVRGASVSGFAGDEKHVA